jgi:hypothetical protein
LPYYQSIDKERADIVDNLEIAENEDILIVEAMKHKTIGKEKGTSFWTFI